MIGYASPGRILLRMLVDQQRVEEVSRRPAHATFVDIGLPIPEQYDSDMLHVLVQSPFRLYAFWEINHRVWQALEKTFPAVEPKDFRTVVKLCNPTWEWEVMYDAGVATQWWFEVYPDEPYQVEVGFYAPQYGYINWLRSRQVRTPRVGTGMESALPEIVSVTTPPAPPPPTEVQEVKAEAPWWVDQLPDWLRQMILKLLRGESLTEEELGQLPAWLQYQLLALWSGVGPQTMRDAFLESIPELIYQAAPETYQKILDIQREEFRLAQAGSDVIAQPPLIHRWFPGLAHPGSWPWGAPGSLFGPHPT
ncbi:MAG: DUF4912 domain-containing protein [Acidobacteria bacterium]|nr:DUF4912 domain-containing protein [Acidobacteriota bacterium]